MMLIIAVWIIALCEIARDIFIIWENRESRRARDNFTNEFFENMTKDNKQWAKEIFEEYLKEEE